MFTERLFHKVAAAFLKHLLPYVTPRVVVTAKNAPDSDCRDLSTNTVCQVPLSTEGGPLKCLKSVHPNSVLRPIYNRKPMQGIQDWCYMFSFMSVSD